MIQSLEECAWFIEVSDEDIHRRYEDTLEDGIVIVE